MNRPRRFGRTPGVVRSLSALAAIAIVALAGAAPAVAAGTGSPPFPDPGTVGGLTFCDRHNQPITSGSLTTVPFVWKAISSVAPPVPYRHGGKTTLGVYQPIKFVDPGDWSGSLLTGSSTFTNPSHPVAQATNADVPLLNFAQSFPPHWKGYAQVRMLFTGVNLPQQTESYPAAVIQIHGNRWTQLSGGGGSCTDGQGTSDETANLPASSLKHPQTVKLVGSNSGTGKGHDGKGHGSGAGTSKSGGGGSSPGGSNSQPSAGASSAASSSGLSGGAKAGIGLGVLAVLGGLAVAWQFLRRRESPTS